MRWLLPLLLLTAALAGCTDAPEDNPGTDGGVSTPFDAGDVECDDVETCEVAGPEGNQVYTCDDPELECTIAWTEEIVETPVDWSGHTKEGVWVLCGSGGLVPPTGGVVPLPLPGCVGQQIQPDGAYQSVVNFEWNLTGVDLTLEWTHADATQTGLALNIVDNMEGTNLGTWEGSSTFTVNEELTADGSTQLLFQVWPVAKDGGGTFVDVTQQEFTLAGNILSTKPVIESIAVEWVGPSN